MKKIYEDHPMLAVGRRDLSGTAAKEGKGDQFSARRRRLESRVVSGDWTMFFALGFP